MKPYAGVKFIALVLCAVFLLVSIGSGAAILYLEDIGLYTQELEDIQIENAEVSLYTLATRICQKYAASTQGGCSQALLDQYYPSAEETKGQWFCTLADADGTILYSTYSGQTGMTARRYEDLTPVYPSVIRYSAAHNSELVPTTQVSEQTRPEDAPAATVDESRYQYVSGFSFFDSQTRTQYNYRLGFTQTPSYTVTLYLLPQAYSADGSAGWQLLQFLADYRYHLFGILAGGLLLFAASFTCLCHWAARKPGSRAIKPGGLNLLPLDLYALAVGAGIWGAAKLLRYFFGWILDSARGPAPLVPALFVTLAACMAVVGFLFALAAQSKMGKHYWLRHTLMGSLACPLWRWFWAFVGLVPIVWRWLAMVGLLSALLVLAMVIGSRWLLGCTLGAAGLAVSYMAYCYATLLKGAKRLGSGKLDTKVSRQAMLGSFRDFAGHLNNVARVSEDAVARQMRSERMKAELITNVSHDIKTPLTSIINYVDLLQKAQDDQQAQGCLEVLQRQSQRMKKLIDDLIELSKASTGNIPVEISSLSAQEAINQALGEFSDKLELAGLTPVFNPPAREIRMDCDGRLTWRVLSNLLSNAVKYALPGTRLYIDLTHTDRWVSISLKNVSREMLCISADELMERFVRGEADRSTEGSGLGLNIARSLMELQKGTLQLTIDGDLFKATLLFPLSE